MKYQNNLFVSIDTHKNHHTAVVINCFYQKLGSVQTFNNPSHYQNLIIV